MFNYLIRRRISDLGPKWVLVFDVDGVLTNGSFFYDKKGKTIKCFGPHDAEAARVLVEEHEVRFISADTRGQDITKRRIADMGFALEIVPAGHRKSYIEDILKSGFPTAFIADSTSDIPSLKAATLSFCPLSANRYVKSCVNKVLKSNGGDGVVEEIARMFCPHYYVENGLT